MDIFLKIKVGLLLGIVLAAWFYTITDLVFWGVAAGAAIIILQFFELFLYKKGWRVPIKRDRYHRKEKIITFLLRLSITGGVIYRIWTPHILPSFGLLTLFCIYQTMEDEYYWRHVHPRPQTSP